MARIGARGPAAYGYTAYGITFEVPFRCHGLTATEPGIPAEVVVRHGTVPRALDAPVASDRRWDIEPGRFLLRAGRRAGRFMVRDGSVTLEPNPAAEEGVVARCFTEEVLPVVLRQRGLLVLHANAAVTPRGVVAIAGESGAGKSTTLAALLERGCAMLADDITALDLTPDGHLEVRPGVGRVSLTEAAVDGLGYRLHPSLDRSWRPTKSALATGESMACHAGRLSAVYVLSTHDGPRAQLLALSGLERFDAVQRCIYGPMLPGEHTGAFPLIRALMESVDVYRLARPSDGWTVPEVADIILDSVPTAAPGG